MITSGDQQHTEAGIVPMSVLVACEFSGTVRDAFRAQGHNAWSCDLLDTEQWGPHIKGDVSDHLAGWDMIIAHPPCTHLAVSGARWFKHKQREQQDALAFVRMLLDAPAKYIALENPVSIISTAIRRPDQIIQPWQFGHGETKATCLWLKNLPPLRPTNIVDGRSPRVHHASPSPALEGAQPHTARYCRRHGAAVGAHVTYDHWKSTEPDYGDEPPPDQDEIEAISSELESDNTDLSWRAARMIARLEIAFINASQPNGD